MKLTFDPSIPVIIHWDKKMVSDFTGKNIECLAIVVSGDGFDKLLSVPKLPAGTGRAQTDAVLNSLYDWEIAEL